jgi:hypothetical protein
VVLLVLCACFDPISIDLTVEVTPETGSLRLRSLGQLPPPVPFGAVELSDLSFISLVDYDWDDAPARYTITLVFCRPDTAGHACAVQDIYAWKGTYVLSGAALTLSPATVETASSTPCPLAVASWVAEYAPGSVRLRVFAEGTGGELVAVFGQGP